MNDKINKFKKELMVRKYSYNTVETYCSCLKVIFDKCGENPTIDSIKDYLLTVKNRNYHKSIIQKLLGHYNIKTTELYAKVSTNLISQVKSPLSNIEL